MPPGSSEALPRDTVGPGAAAINGRRFVTLALWTWHTLVTVLYPSTPWALCPCRHNLTDTLFTWSSYTAVALAVIIIAAPIRLLAFRQLGENFTFRLAKPKALVTTGLYAHVRHPSYPTNWLVWVANLGLLLRLDGVLGCVMPSVLVRWGMRSGLWPALLLGLALMSLISIWVRVQDEEAMLKGVFGKEWEEYHVKTPRFIPWVF
ncbi:hypothetical protein QQS21_000551 [Conoideocrella luteorostrata]|uniref:Protein-S-isoprenylcysteine O-methyltransferase n=1 Tax=Conoideocrella luteorostrata TaxID=1105319 RepID=A0AAJ0G3Y8_9HYPO|nr:hypothetical protein QQS21_000551 [Conoideocrella luteorostrata]